MTPDRADGVVTIIQRPFGAAGRLFRTVWNLRPGQIVNRYTRRLSPLRIDASGAGPLRRPIGRLQPFIERPQSLLAPLRFRFLNATHDIERPASWNDPALPRLWIYNLHYFDDLNAQDASQRRQWHEQWLRRWLQENPPPAGTAWEPYPASLRTVNLAKWLLQVESPPAHAHQAFVMSTRAVAGQLEYHLLANHLWTNAKALIVAGLCLEGAEARRWKQRGTAILRKQIADQILADGAHFERSPMYQAILVEDALDLVNLASAFGEWPPGGIDKALPAMLSWLGSMTHPDGEIAFFNDAATGIAAKPAALLEYARRFGIEPAATAPIVSRTGIRAVDLPASGYARLETGLTTDPRAVVICDAAEVGPACMPGHVHADSLSFEMSLGDQRVIVNGGTSTYALCERRRAERRTANHSTVQLAQADSSEVWESFRCGARASIIERQWRAGDDVISLRAAHDGYAFIKGSWIHQRTWELRRGGLTVRDNVVPRELTRAIQLPVTVRFLLHPQIEIAAGAGPSEWPLHRQGVRIATLETAPELSWSVEPASYAPAFGVVEPTLAIVGRIEIGAAAEFRCGFRFGSSP